MTSIAVGDVQVRYSGGASNILQSSSIGGAISTNAAGFVISQAFTNPSAVTGVTISDCIGNALGAGSLKFTKSTNTLEWKPFGGSTYHGLVIGTNGHYTLGDSSGYLIVDVVFASFPSGDQTDSITVSNALNKTFDNITAVEALNGMTDYRCFYIKNTHASGVAFDVKIWIKANTSGPDDCYLALDTGGKNVQAIGPIADENDSGNALSGLSWTQPGSGTPLSLGNLSAGDYRAFWVKRTIPNNSSQVLATDTFSIGISALL